MAEKYEYRFAWKNTPERAKLFGKRCRVLAQGTRMRSIWIEFEDGHREIVSQRAIRRAD